jgi:hypothetical protein
MESAWKLQASQVSSKAAGFPWQRSPCLITPDCLQIFMAHSFPALSLAIAAKVKISSVVEIMVTSGKHWLQQILSFPGHCHAHLVNIAVAY